MSVPGHRIGQAANLAHEWIIAVYYQGHGSLADELFVKTWKERTKFYIENLNDMEKDFSNDDEDWTDKVPPKRPTPVKLDLGDGEVIDINN